MNTFDQEDYAGVLECATAKILSSAGIEVFYTRGKYSDDGINSDVQTFQKEWPKVELEFTDQNGRGQYFHLLGVQPEAGFVPDRGREGSMDVTLVTEADFTQHSMFIGTVRRQFHQIAIKLNALINPLYWVQTVISQETVPGIHSESGFFKSKLQFKYRYSLRYSYACVNDQTPIGTVTPVITSAAPSSFGVQPVGKYAVVYVNGAMKYSSIRGFQINRTVDDHEFKVSYSLNDAQPGLVTGPGDSNEYATQALCEATNANAQIVFDHSGGVINIYLQDFPYSDNRPGDPNPTFSLYRVTCGFQQQSITI